MLAVLAAFPVAAVAQLQESCDRSATAAAIEAQRDAFNRAIRDADLAAIEGVLAEDVVLVTGTWSDLFPDRAAPLRMSKIGERCRTYMIRGEVMSVHR